MSGLEIGRVKPRARRWLGRAATLRHTFSLLRYQGPRWLLFRCRYLLKQRRGWFERELPCGEWNALPAVDVPQAMLDAARRLGQRPAGSDLAVQRADRIVGGQLSWFSRHQHATGFPPRWFDNPWEPDRAAPDLRHWSLIGDFAGGDIKCVWEQSRFGFVFPLVRAYMRTKDSRYVEAFWRAVEDWRDKNPPQRGPHWKCGQEIGLRVMAWLFGLLHFLDHPATTSQRRRQLIEMLETSGVRIAANVDYALSQHNNHGITEAAAMFTLGALLERPDWLRRGQSLLDTLADELIYDDGAFSQHSTNYHRLMLHDYLWAIWIGRLVGCPMRDVTVERIRKAGLWLKALMCPSTGRVPNLGANDGAHFLDLTDLDYLDYRPVVQGVGLLTEGRAWLPRGPWDELAKWLGGPANANPCGRSSNPGDSPLPAGSGERMKRDQVVPNTRSDGDRLVHFPDGGYAVWRHAGTIATLRCPTRFRHRPGQCDMLHFDLSDGEGNLLRDAGSFSYNCDEFWCAYFGSSRAHNVVCVDNQDPMPKIGRFLYGQWPVIKVETDGRAVTAGYRDHRGIHHRRTVCPTPEGYRIEDAIDGRFRHATLRWRLDPQIAWTVTGQGCRSPRLTLDVSAASTALPIECRMAEGSESLHYMERSPLPVFEVDFGPETGSVVTEIRLAGR